MDILGATVLTLENCDHYYGNSNEGIDEYVAESAFVLIKVTRTANRRDVSPLIHSNDSVIIIVSLD